MMDIITKRKKSINHLSQITLQINQTLIPLCDRKERHSACQCQENTTLPLHSKTAVPVLTQEHETIDKEDMIKSTFALQYNQPGLSVSFCHKQEDNKCVNVANNSDWLNNINSRRVICQFI